MKSSKDLVFEYVQKELLVNDKYKNDGGISTNDVASYFKLQRTNASTLLNELVKEGKLTKTNSRPVLYCLNIKNDVQEILLEKPLIGEKGSLQGPLQVAKAAMLYPNKSLNLLVLGKPGVGVSHFVYTLYWMGVYAKAFNSTDSFYKVNCRHFLDNMDELDDLLFRDSNLEETYFCKAKKGMLFIDNCDLLNSRQKATLFDFIDSGFIYSKDRKERINIDDVFIVLSCHPSAASSFRNKLPMVVELSELKDRPLKEKLDLINYFFTREASVAKREIEINKDVLLALLLTEFPHNIKELQMEIVKACATACVRVMDNSEDRIEVTIYDLNSTTQKNLLKLRYMAVDNDFNNEINELIGTQTLFIYSDRDNVVSFNDNSNDDIYNSLKSQYNELSSRGINDEAIQGVINNHVDTLFKHYNYYQSYDKNYDVEQLSKIVDNKVIDLVKDLLATCSKELNRNFKSHVFYGLCLHMNSLLSLPLGNNRIDDKQVKEIISNYPKEYSLTTQFAKEFERVFNINLPVDEMVIITMFLIKNDEVDDTHPKLLYVLHGNGAASSLKEVTNALTHSYNVYSYDLLLDKDTKVAQQELKDLVLSIDDGSGIVVIYDMGSIKTMFDTISEQCHIKIRYFYIPITLVGLEIARKCIQENDVDNVYHSTMREFANMITINDIRKEAIITLCHTGEGGAIQLKRYIDQYSKLNMKTIPLSVSDRDELIEQVVNLKKMYRIQCFVGTYDPRLFGIPFISMAKVFENSPEDLDNVLTFTPVKLKQMDYSGIYNSLEKEFKYISVNKLKTILPEIIDELSNLYSLNNDQKVGLFIHIACVLEYYKAGNLKVKKDNYQEIIKEYNDDFKAISKILKPLEKKFDVIIDDEQIGIIISVIRKL